MDAQVARLAGDVAFVTGASRGIGLAVASELARAGARVALFARSPQTLADARAAIGEDALAIAGDVTSPAAVTGAVERAEAQLGPITLLVHNAGTANIIGPLWEAEPDAWWDEVAGHLRGAMLTCRAVLPGMVSRGRGRVVLMYGNLGEAVDPWCSAYACGKAGLLRLVDQLGAELKDARIGVFGVHPGLVWTPMTAAFVEDPEKRRWIPRFGERPREHFGSPDAAAQLIVRIAIGHADRLSGLLLGAGDDLEALREDGDRIRDESRRVLRTSW